MNEQSVAIENVQGEQALRNFESFIKRTLKFPISKGYDARCYCRKCGGSYDMTAKAVGILIERSPECFKDLPLGVRDLSTVEDIRRCYFVVEPCFACSKHAKIITEVRLYPHTNGYDKATYSRNGKTLKKL